MITIQGRLPSYNEYINSCRRNRYAGAKFKEETENLILWQVKGKKIPTPCTLKIVWYEPNRKRDIDNVFSGAKFLLDAFVKAGVIPNDTQQFIRGISNKIELDRKNPRIEIEWEV